MKNPAIEIKGLTKDYAIGFWRKRMRRSLDYLTLNVEEGETFGFLGPNGAGKTTTMKLLMGLIFPTAGTARIRGRSISDVRMHRDIGYMPEQPYFYDYLTARELLDYFARFFGYSAGERRERVSRFWNWWALPLPAMCSCESFPRACCSAWGSRRPSCTIRRLCFWMNRCPASIPWDVARCGTSSRT